MSSMSVAEMSLLPIGRSPLAKVRLEGRGSAGKCDIRRPCHIPAAALVLVRRSQSDDRKGYSMSTRSNGKGGAAAPAIEVRQLRKTYGGGVDAVAGIEFDVEPGEVFGLLGPNGAGKSTTIGMLTTTVAPTSGRARVAGFDVVADPLSARAASAVVFQEAVADRSLTGRRNLEIHARLWGVPAADARTRLGEIIRRFDLAGLVDRPVATYSGGERRRLEIARALLSQPQVLFLDEPTVGLDPRIRYELLDVIGGLRARDEMTIVLTT